MFMCTEYGAAEESEFAVKSTSLKSTLVSLHLCSRDKTVVKKLPRSMLVTRLVSLVQRLFNTETAVPSLSCRSVKVIIMLLIFVYVTFYCISHII